MKDLIGSTVVVDLFAYVNKPMKPSLGGRRNSQPTNASLPFYPLLVQSFLFKVALLFLTTSYCKLYFKQTGTPPLPIYPPIPNVIDLCYEETGY